MTAAHEEARYAQVLRFPSRQELVRRFPPLVAGLFIIGFSIAISVRAQLGVAPWDVLHQSLAKATHTSIGPLTHAGLRRFHLPVSDDAPEVMGE